MYKIVEFAKVLMKDFIVSLNKENIICVDATLGNGFDSLFLSKLINNNGTIYAYDIQQESINNSTKLFKENKQTNRNNNYNNKYYVKPFRNKTSTIFLEST